MILKSLHRLLFVAAVLALSVPLYAAETITHQGRLLDATDQPVADGTYSATFSLWDDPVAGNMVWSELQDIQTKSGLFSAELGKVSSFFDIFTEFADRDLYLQVQVQVSGSMETLSPRLHVGSAPSALTARKVHGLHHGENRASSCLVIATDSGAVSYLDQDSDGDGVADRRVTEQCDDGDASMSLSSRAPGSGGGGGAGGSVVLSAADLSSSVSLAGDLDGDGLDDGDASLNITPTTSSMAINRKGTGAEANRTASVTCSATPGGASSVCSLDLDGDGVLDRRVDEDCDDLSASRSMSFFDVFTESAIDDDCDGTEARRRLSSSNLGSSGQDGVSVDMRCSPDSAVGSTEVRKSGSIVCADYGRHTPFHNSRSSSFFDVFNEMTIDQDCDATGSRLAIKTKGTSAQRTVACSTDASTSSVVASGDLDGDGVDDVVVMSVADATSASQMLGKKGLNAVNVKLARTISNTVDDAAAVQAIDDDSDDDGVMDRSISSSCDATSAKHAINTKGTGANTGRVVSVSSSTDESSASSACGVDLDGDGVADSQIEQRCTPDSVVQVAEISGGGGGGGGGSSYNMRTRIDQLEQVLKNFGLLGTGRAMQACGDGSASVSCDLDVDNNSIVEGTAWGKVDNTDASCGASTDSNQDGTPDVSASIASSATRSILKGYFQSGDVPTQSQFSALLDSDGAHSLLSSGMSGSTTGTIRMAATPDSTVFDLGYHGSTTGTIRLMASSSGSDNPIEHSSGAHLTPGGVWTNASDENLKENFQPVDGEKILDKIEQLPISQWNYKNESDEVTHIGPTAQDFKAAFGVGDNNKSISTIDPSGIALVAVKELRKENQELKTQVAELKKMVEELAKKK